MDTDKLKSKVIINILNLTFWANTPTTNFLTGNIEDARWI